VNARVHLGADAPIVRLRWMFTDAPFLHVEGGCVFMNRIWDQDYFSELPVGQLPFDQADFVQDARWKLPAGFNPNHTCHEEWLSTGEPYPNDLPDTEYTDDQIPFCCFEPPPTRGGGITIGGSAGDVYRPGYPTSGGMVIGGRAGNLIRRYDRAEGGIEVGGSAGDVYTPPSTTAGGIEIGGETGDQQSFNDATDGGIEIGGFVPDFNPSGIWERYVNGHYTFTAEFTGLHRIQCYGGGGAGANSTTGGGMDIGGGGGGGGAEANIIVALVKDTSYSVDVGAGGTVGATDGVDTKIELPTVIIYCLAKGGKSAVDQSAGIGGRAIDCIGDQAWDGGDGADSGPNDPGGGGGSSAVFAPFPPPFGTGGSASGSTGGVVPFPSGGDGGDGGSPPANGEEGGFWSGGGGGGGAGGGLGALGHDGAIIIIWPPGL
jgi:hypothetical protein